MDSLCSAALNCYPVLILTAQSGITSSSLPAPLWDSAPPSDSLAETELVLSDVTIPLRVWNIEGELWLHYTGIGQFHISSDGSCIHYWLEPDSDDFPAGVVERALAFVAIMALHKRGALCLHASSVALDGGAIAFMGDSGAGKSTFATALLAAGAALVADDITPITLTDGRAMALPMGSHLKLMPDIAEGKLEEEALASTFSPPFEKHLVTADQLGGRHAEGATPLRRIFLLERSAPGSSAGVHIEPLTGHRLGAALLANSYLGPWLPVLGLQHAWMEQIDALSRSVPVSILHYGNGPQALAEAQEAVFHFLEQQSPL